MATFILKKWFLLILMLLTVSGQNSPSVFQCQFSSQPSGFFYTPNIPDFYFNDENYIMTNEVAELVNGITHIFTLPSESVQRNCSGRVESIQYCYQARDSDIGQTREAFNFLSFVQELVEDGVKFTVNSSIIIQTTPEDSICSDPPGGMQQICCDTAFLNATDQFQIPPSTYTFGVGIINNNVKPLAFANTVTEYRVEQYLASFSSLPSGFMFTLTENDKVNRSLLLLRFSIVPTATTSPAVIESATTIPPAAPEPATTTPPAVIESATIIPPTTIPPTDPVVTELVSTTLPAVTEPTTGLVNTTGRSNSKSGGAVGGAIGGCMTILAIIVIITCVVVVVVLIKRRKKRENSTLENAIYGVDSTQTSSRLRGSSDATYEYADSGPQVYSKPSHHLGGTKDGCKNFYADSGASYEVPFPVNVKQRNPLDEDIYMVPAKEENTLYAQLRNISSKDLIRDSVKLGDLLGSGQFGMVYKGVLQSADGEVEVAVKTLKEGSKKEDRVKFLQEAAIMGQFKHPNVVTLYGVVTDGEPILLVLELLRKGDLRDHLVHKRNKDKEGSINVDDHTLLSYCRQVASGMAYLSSKDFVHRDLAARNILVSDDEICKIADFGMSRDLMDESYYVSHGGKIPVKWTAPEALHYKKYSTASDVWSYGALLYEIWSVGHKPFESLVNAQVLKLIETGSRLSPPPGCPRAIYTIMISCWNPVASQRPNFADITQQLSLPDTKLLKWSEEDKSVHPEATKLGADLLCGQELYKDLQTCYQAGKSQM